MAFLGVYGCEHPKPQQANTGMSGGRVTERLRPKDRGGDQ